MHLTEAESLALQQAIRVRGQPQAWSSKLCGRNSAARLRLLGLSAERDGRLLHFDVEQHGLEEVPRQVEQADQLVPELRNRLLLQLGAGRNGERLGHVAREHGQRAAALAEDRELRGGLIGAERANGNARCQQQTKDKACHLMRGQSDLREGGWCQQCIDQVHCSGDDGGEQRLGNHVE
eukprot:6208042-Pleurochrysis_carterae.AAC.1